MRKLRDGHWGLNLEEQKHGDQIGESEDGGLIVSLEGLPRAPKITATIVKDEDLVVTVNFTEGLLTKQEALDFLDDLKTKLNAF